MNRRSFINQSLAGAVLPATTFADNTKTEKLKTSHVSDIWNTTIKVETLKKPLKVLQISDTHISLNSEADKKFDEYRLRMGRAYQSVKHYKTGEPTTPADCFKELMQLALKEKVDLIALSGDMVNYPSETDVTFVLNEVKATGIPHIYVAGNHDWHYEGMKGTANVLRDEWCKKILKPLYTGDIYNSSTIIGGINFVMIDNSTYQVNQEQLAFYKQQTKRPEPIALFVHIPLYVPGMKICCGHPEWGADVDKNFELERRERWPKEGNSASTIAFVSEVAKTSNLIAVFCGHIHRFEISQSENMFQYTAMTGLNGQYRLINFEPYS